MIIMKLWFLSKILKFKIDENENNVVDGGVTSQLIRFVAKYNSAGSPDKTEDEGHISRSISLQILQSLISKF